MKRQWKVSSGLVLVILMVVFAKSAFAEEYPNVGFKKDVPKELKQKFPMCEEFLDVKWIGKNKEEDADIGKLIIERYEYDKKKGILHLLVLSKKPGLNFYKLKKQDYYSKSFEKFIKESTFYELSGRNFMFKLYVGEKGLEGSDKVYSLRNFELWNMGMIPSENQSSESFSIFTKTVCALYPDAQSVFIAEAKMPFLPKEKLTDESKQTYDLILRFIDEKCNQRKLELAESMKKEFKCFDGNMNRSTGNSTALDINLDGINDYMFTFSLESYTGPKEGGWFVYFSKNGAYESKNIDDCIKSGPLYFKANEKAFYFGKCNLTNTLTKENK